MEILDYYQEIQQHDLTEAKNDCRSSRGNSADGIHGAHEDYRVSTGEGPALAWNLRDRARAASDQRRRRAPLGKIPWHAPQFWMNLQADYDLRRAAASAPLSKIKPRSAA